MPNFFESSSACSDISGQNISVETLNRECLCLTLDRHALNEQLKKTVDSVDIYESLQEMHFNLFAAVPVFTSRKVMDDMSAIIFAIRQTVALPAYRERILAAAPDIARLDPGASGVFMGYDFHLGKDGPKLIEINTNAGGALLNTVLAKAQRACCASAESMLTGALALDGVEDSMVAMFIEEHQLARPGELLRTIAIVDDDPASQFLYPEFLLFKHLFARHGIDAVIADPREFSLHNGELRHDTKKIDLVYNRLTDFYFTREQHATLRQAYVERAAVFTPHPQGHALYANKRNLALLSDADMLTALGVPAVTAGILLNGIPRTRIVDPHNADSLWVDRRHLFFKPAQGFGSKAAYRGEKITRRVWSEILEGDYVAQALVPPSERMVRAEGDISTLKLDVRCYVYREQIQLTAARLYQGQTTNFRTEGGGFAPVFVLDRPHSCNVTCS